MTETPRPTRIVAKPYPVTGRRRDGLAFHCDNGVIYKTGELARCIIGITPSSLLGRLKRCGWQDPHILDHVMPRKKKNQRRGERSEVGDDRIETSSLRHLSGRSRDRNLKKIPVGSFERNL